MKLKQLLYEALKEGDYDMYANDSGEKFWGNVGAGVLPIANDTKRILVSYRSKYVNEPHTWGVIGGKIDDEAAMNIKGEALRELKEEAGYTGNVKLYDAYVFKAKGFSYHNFIGLLETEFIPNKDWETEKFKWLSYDQLMKLSPKHFGLNSLLADTKSMQIIEDIVNGKISL